MALQRRKLAHARENALAAGADERSLARLAIAVERADDATPLLEELDVSVASFEAERRYLALMFERWAAQLRGVNDAQSSGGRTARLNGLIIAMSPDLTRYKRALVNAIGDEKRLAKAWEQARDRAATCRAEAARLVGLATTTARRVRLHEALAHERVAAKIRERGIVQSTAIDDLRCRHRALLEALARAKAG
jgi:hypothetical protein